MNRMACSGQDGGRAAGGAGTSRPRLDYTSGRADPEPGVVAVDPPQARRPLGRARSSSSTPWPGATPAAAAAPPPPAQRGRAGQRRPRSARARRPAARPRCAPAVPGHLWRQHPRRLAGAGPSPARRGPRPRERRQAGAGQRVFTRRRRHFAAADGSSRFDFWSPSRRRPRSRRLACAPAASRSVTLARRSASWARGTQEFTDMMASIATAYAVGHPHRHQWTGATSRRTATTTAWWPPPPPTPCRTSTTWTRRT